MKKKILALYDSEKDYLDSLAEYLKGREAFPFVLHAYSEVDKLLEFGRKEQIDVLLVSESDFTYELSKLEIGKTLLLNESGTVRGENIKNIDKYQKAENIWYELMCDYADFTESEGKRLVTGTKTKLIGLYSPVRRCLQTSFALTLGQTLAEKKKTLYISFEHYAGWNQLLDKNVRGDLTALLYFGKEPEEKFFYRLQSMTMKIGELYYIPPAYAGQNLIYVSAKEWEELIQRIAEIGGYDYIILDLSESIQGTFEILCLCDRIYTIIQEEERARAKLAQYEEILRAYEYEEVLEKTKKEILPQFAQLPERIEQYMVGELARYIRKLIREDLGAA